MKSFASLMPLIGLAAAAEWPSYCGPSVVTVTETNYHYVTASSTPEVPSTSVVYVIETPSPIAHVPHYPPYSNGTWNHTAVRPTTLRTITFVLPSSVNTDVETVQPEPTSYQAEPTSYQAPSPAETSAEPEKNTAAPAPAPIPTSETPAAPAPSAAPVEDSTPEVGKEATSGKATFYGGNLSGGMCSFTGYTLPAGLFGTAFSGPAWDNGANCGRCVNVKGPNGKTIKAMVVDQCPECEPSHLDLFQDAFAQIGSISDGIIPISYDFVDCGISSPITLKNKEGTSPYWFSMQVMNSNKPISKLEVSTDGGSSWKSTTRQEYNYFENPSGYGTSSVDVKVTSTDGQSITVKDVSIAASSTKTGSSNFS